MSKLLVLGIAFLLLLAAFPLISFGTTGDNDTLWWIGLGVLVVGGLVPPVARYVLPDDEASGGEEDEEESGRRADNEPAEIRVARADGAEQGGESATPGRGDPRQPSPQEHRARAHEERAEDHRERAKSHEELARAEEERAEAAEEGEVGPEQEPRRHGNGRNGKP
jgi:hypothetical protein